MFSKFTVNGLHEYAFGLAKALGRPPELQNRGITLTLSPMAKAPYQDGLTIITSIEPGREEALVDVLRQIVEDDVEENALVPFGQLETVHFARWVILEASRDARGRVIPASLVFSTNFDAPAKRHLEELYEKAQTGLDRIYECCTGYPPPGQRTRASVLSYFRRHEVGHNTLYVGTRGRTVEQIQREAALRDALQEFLDEATRRPEFLKQTPLEIRADLQRFVLGRPDLKWAADPPPAPRRFWPHFEDALPLAAAAGLILAPLAVGRRRGSARAGLRALAGLLGTSLLGLGGWAGALRLRESRDTQDPATTDFQHVRDLARREDIVVQNQMSSVTHVKQGWLRLITLRTVLWAIDLAGRYVYTKGQLGTISSIHFARWVIIDEGRRLLFFSNFDGSWENYLGDFIDKAATGLTAVWSNTHGFPKSRWLVYGGATDEQRFKAYARTSQVVTQVWYSAYKRLSVQNINNNSQIRAGLFSQQTPEEAAAWLQRL